jgi:hypothetical protein
MKKFISRSIVTALLFLFSAPSPALYGAISGAQAGLKLQYDLASSQPTDINEHVFALRCLAMQCSTVVEIGLRSMVSTWGILQGLSESATPSRSYLGIDLSSPPAQTLRFAGQLAEGNEIAFHFLQANDMDIEMGPTDMLFIDSLHTYCHLTYELETFSPYVKKYIAMHDTSAPWGDADDITYYGDYSEYPSEYNQEKRGLWSAVVDFLKRHPEWTLYQRSYNNYGFTILKRVV